MHTECQVLLQQNILPYKPKLAFKGQHPCSTNTEHQSYENLGDALTRDQPEENLSLVAQVVILPTLLRVDDIPDAVRMIPLRTPASSAPSRLQVTTF